MQSKYMKSRFSKRALTSSLQTTLYNAYAGLGFKCSHCSSKSDLFIINKNGRQAHLALKSKLGKDWLWFIATNSQVREQHRLVCKTCFFSLYASKASVSSHDCTRASSPENKHANELDYTSS
jgi:hypothetical protein